MIDFRKAEESFKNYLKNYDVEDGNIKLKIKHTYEVVRKSEYIAKGLNLSNEDIELAKLIGLLHDIGRFEQVKQTSDFIDNDEFDHADYGVKVLFEYGMIRDFTDESKYDDIIKKAIYNHNKYKIGESLNDRELLHSKIIRDADKLDNFRVKEKEHFKNIFPSVYNAETLEYEEISDSVYEAIMRNQCVQSSDRRTQIDYWICFIGFIFDLNFDISLNYIKEKNYVDIVIDRIDYKNNETKEKMEKIRKVANDFLDEKGN
jgi:putative nucleotidyltransferase with HDIG domain